jgi:hypothetical protein
MANPQTCLSSAILITMAIVLGGCSSGGAMNASSWRDTVEKYIEVEGKGDPNILRGVTWPNSRRSFSAIGGEIPRESQDANGLLVAVQSINNRPWFIFVVGVVNKQVVESIHIEALNMQGKSQTWKSSADNPKALQAYRDYYDRLWKQRFPGRQSAPAQYSTFPKEADTFAVTLEAGGKVVVTHPLSGARWEVVVDPKASPAVPVSPPATRQTALESPVAMFAGR